MHPVRADLAADIDAVIGHAEDELLEQIEVLFALIEAVGVIRHMQHAAMDADGCRAHAQEVGRCRIEVVWRAGETDLKWEELVFWVRPVCRLLVARHAARSLVRGTGGKTRGASRVSGLSLVDIFARSKRKANQRQ